MFGSERLPPRSKKVPIEANAFARMMSVARELDVHDSRQEARQDGYREVLTVLMDEFEANDE
jgi:hypothetical protein